MSLAVERGVGGEGGRGVGGPPPLPGPFGEGRQDPCLGTKCQRVARNAESKITDNLVQYFEVRKTAKNPR